MERFADLRPHAADVPQNPNAYARNRVSRRQMSRSPQTANAFAPYIVAPPSN